MFQVTTTLQNYKICILISNRYIHNIYYGTNVEPQTKILILYFCIRTITVGSIALGHHSHMTTRNTCGSPMTKNTVNIAGTTLVRWPGNIGNAMFCGGSDMLICWYDIDMTVGWKHPWWYIMLFICKTRTYKNYHPGRSITMGLEFKAMVWTWQEGTQSL